MPNRSTFLSLVLVIWCARAWGSDQGSIEGSVADPSGAMVAGAAVKARRNGTAALFVATTDRRGRFRMPVLPIGIYEVTAEQPPLASGVCRDIQVTVGARIDLVLRLGSPAIAESVVVEPPLVETTRSQVSTTVDSRAISSLPVSARNVLDFVLLAPGVTRDARLGDLSFAGQRAMNSLLVDGADDNNSFFGQALGRTGSGRAPYQFSLESVAEFQVSSSSYSAELGRAGGGVVNVVTRSGGNDFHCTLFWNYRDRALEATDFISRLNGQPKPPDHFHQYGALLSGPLRRDHLFFFILYDGQRSRLPNPTFLNLPAGFSPSADAATAAFQRRALDYLAPRARSWNRTFDQDVYFARVDWQPRPGHALSARANVQRFAGKGIENFGPQNSFEHTGAAEVSTDSLTLSGTSALPWGLVNTARLSWIRDHEPGFADGVEPEANVFEGGQLVLTVGRNPVSPRRQTIHRGHFNDTIVSTHGPHALKVGADILIDRVDLYTAQNFSGSYRFNSLAGFGRSLAGHPTPAEGEFYRQAFAAEGTAGVTVHPGSLDVAAFVQDDWRLRRSLTLNLGLRYDIEWMAAPALSNTSPALAAHGIDTGRIPLDAYDVAPRLGLAWATPSRRLALRAAYGIFYGRTPGLMISRPHFQNGVTIQTLAFVAGTAGASIPAYPDTLCGPAPRDGTPPTCPAPTSGAGDRTLVLFARDYRQPLVHQANLAVERALGSVTVSATYLAALGRRLQRTRDVNLPAPAPATIGVAGTPTLLAYRRFVAPRPVAGFDRIWEFESTAHSAYNGLVLQASKRFSRGTQFAASYTFGRAMDDAPDFVVATPGQDDGRMLSDSSDPRADRGPGVDDQRHRFVLSGVWVVPVAARRRGVVRSLLGGWQLSGILVAQSGQPYSGMVGFDLNGDGNPASDRTPGEARNAFSRPGTLNLDARIVRSVRLGGRGGVQFIGDAFNVFNRANVTGVRTTEFARSTSAVQCGVAGIPCLVRQDSGSSAFGTPTATSGPRSLQLAARILF